MLTIDHRKMTVPGGGVYRGDGGFWFRRILVPVRAPGQAYPALAMAARICGTSRDDSSKEIVYGIVERTQSAPSSSFGMNSAPTPANKSSESANDANEPPITRRGCVMLQASPLS